MLVLAKLHNVIGKIPQLQVREAVVSEVFQEPGASSALVQTQITFERRKQ